jgi:mRNA interferase MazF
MPIFETWDIVKVPFPYIDRPVRQRRPALVIAARELVQDDGLLWVAMITSAANRGWVGDVPIADLSAAGLPISSIVRPTKIATIDARDAEPLGNLSASDRTTVAECLRRLLAAALDPLIQNR